MPRFVMRRKLGSLREEDLINLLEEINCDLISEWYPEARTEVLIARCRTPEGKTETKFFLPAVKTAVEDMRPVYDVYLYELSEEEVDELGDYALGKKLEYPEFLKKILIS